MLKLKDFINAYQGNSEINIMQNGLTLMTINKHIDHCTPICSLLGDVEISYFETTGYGNGLNVFLTNTYDDRYTE